MLPQLFVLEGRFHFLNIAVLEKGYEQKYVVVQIGYARRKYIKSIAIPVYKLFKHPCMGMPIYKLFKYLCMGMPTLILQCLSLWLY